MAWNCCGPREVFPTVLPSHQICRRLYYLKYYEKNKSSRRLAVFCVYHAQRLAECKITHTYIHTPLTVHTHTYTHYWLFTHTHTYTRIPLAVHTYTRAYTHTTGYSLTDTHWWLFTHGSEYTKASHLARMHRPGLSGQQSNWPSQSSHGSILLTTL